MISSSALTIAGIVVSIIAIAARVFFFIQGRNNANLKRAQNDNKALAQDVDRLASRPRSDDDIERMLIHWNDIIKKKPKD